MTEAENPMSDAVAARIPGADRLLGSIRADQMLSVRKGVRIAVPVNILLSFANMFVAWRYGEIRAGVEWLAAATTINMARASLFIAPRAERTVLSQDDYQGSHVERQLQLAWMTALLSGLVWAFVPALCAGYTGPQTLFYLVVGCGITAGAVTHGTAYARVPIAFITLPLLSAIGCMVHAGGVDRDCLAGTMLLYLATLIYTARVAEAGFRDTSRLKNEATATVRSLEVAHARTRAVADEMRYRANHDALTGLLNRAGFLQEARLRAKHDTHATCLMLLDLDGFKAINDALGHKAGDDLLVEVARRLSASLPSEVTIGRLGGDEFALSFEVRPTADPPALVASRITAAIEIPYSAFEVARVGISIGIHVAHGVDLAEMLPCADEALYAAKSAGRNRHYLFDDALRSRLDMRRDVERDLARALAGNELDIWFQPIFGDGGRTLRSFEALIRWRHPKHDWIPPADLMAIAAMTGLAEPLMDFILRNVFTMICDLHERGLGHLCVAMNVSPREMSQLPVADLILAELATRRIPSSMIEVEITEETALDIPNVQQKLIALAEAGVRITIDDFGVGYSSLASLRRFHVDRVKIDRSFVSGLAESTENQGVVQAVLHLGRLLGFDVVAEGVETLDDLCTLQALGADYMQGYHLGRPMPMSDAIALVDGSARPRTVQRVKTAGADTSP